MDSITKDTELVSGYKNFLDSGKTERECVTAIVALAEAQGYKNIESVKSLSAGDKVYVRKMNKSVMLVNVGSGSIADGMNILGAHIDSPRLDVKQNPIYDRDFVVYLNTHYYGGIKKYQWVTMPLAIHGVICKTDGTTVTVNVGEKEDDPVFCISDILPHMAQDQMKEKASEFIPGEILDLIIGSTIPAKDNGDNKDEKKPSAKKAVLALLEQTYGIKEADLLSAELEVVPAGKARDSGLYWHTVRTTVPVPIHRLKLCWTMRQESVRTAASALIKKRSAVPVLRAWQAICLRIWFPAWWRKCPAATASLRCAAVWKTAACSPAM